MTEPTPAEPLTSQALAAPHGFFTRLGGVSTGPYASLNGSLSGQDDPAAVAENRARVARAVGARPDRLIGLTQVHGSEVITAEAAWPVGQGPRADALVTSQAGLALGIITADCAPVLLADQAAGVVGAAHAGWRGAAAGVLEATVAAMARLGADPARIAAAIGPCIAQGAYEVGTDMRDAVLATDPAAAPFFIAGQRPGHFQFDLAGLCAARLARAGLTRIDQLSRDTLTDPTHFFSHRRRTLAGGGPIGHQISVIML